MAYVLINHGWTNVRPQDHWQRRLAVALRRQGHQVFYPQYPNTLEPNFAEWSWLLNSELEILLETRGDSNDEIVVIGHSLGNVLWLKAATDALLPSGLQVDRLLMVAPPERTGISQLPSFDITHTDAEIRDALARSAKSISLLGSDNDPWSPSGLQAAIGDPLGLQALIIPGAAHLSSKDGWGPWQGVIDWVNNPEADLTRR
jgi:predicted alpha/beta hydrolase family esterase